MSSYSAPLWLQMFTNLSNWETVLRIWDIFLLEGKVSMYRFSLALLLAAKETLLNAPTFEDIVSSVLRFPASTIIPGQIVKLAMELDIQKAISEASAESSVLSPPSKTPSHVRHRKSVIKSATSRKETTKKKQSEAKQSSFFSKLLSDFTNLTTDTPKKRQRVESPLVTPLGIDRKKRRSESTASPIKGSTSQKVNRSLANKENWGVNSSFLVEDIRKSNPQSFNEFTTPTKSPQSKAPLSNRSSAKPSEKKILEIAKPIELIDFTPTKLL